MNTESVLQTSKWPDKLPYGKRRAAFQIKMDILNGLRENGPTTRYTLMLGARVNHPIITSTLKSLIRLGLVLTKDLGTHHLFMLSESGQKVLSLYEEIQNFLDEKKLD